MKAKVEKREDSPPPLSASKSTTTTATISTFSGNLAAAAESAKDVGKPTETSEQNTERERGTEQKTSRSSKRGGRRGRHQQQFRWRPNGGHFYHHYYSVPYYSYYYPPIAVMEDMGGYAGWHPDQNPYFYEHCDHQPGAHSQWTGAYTSQMHPQVHPPNGHVAEDGPNSNEEQGSHNHQRSRRHGSSNSQGRQHPPAPTEYQSYHSYAYHPTAYQPYYYQHNQYYPQQLQYVVPYHPAPTLAPDTLSNGHDQKNNKLGGKAAPKTRSLSDEQTSELSDEDHGDDADGDSLLYCLGRDRFIDLFRIPPDHKSVYRIGDEILATAAEYPCGEFSGQRLYIFLPYDLKPRTKNSTITFGGKDDFVDDGTPPRPCIFFVHGGSWGGHPRLLATQSAYLRLRGYVVANVHFRPPKKHYHSPQDTLADVRLAYRWVVRNAKRFHIDPNLIIVSGNNAGGHLAMSLSTISLPNDPLIRAPQAVVASALEGEFDDRLRTSAENGKAEGATEGIATRADVPDYNTHGGFECCGRTRSPSSSQISEISDATEAESHDVEPLGFILFNPLIDLVDGWPAGKKKCVGFGIEPESFSPAHRIREGLPPTLILSGADDELVSPDLLRSFQEKMVDAGNRCEFVEYTNAPHEFFNTGARRNFFFRRTMDEFERFVEDLVSAKVADTRQEARTSDSKQDDESHVSQAVDKDGGVHGVGSDGATTPNTLGSGGDDAEENCSEKDIPPLHSEGNKTSERSEMTVARESKTEADTASQCHDTSPKKD